MHSPYQKNADSNGNKNNGKPPHSSPHVAAAKTSKHPLVDSSSEDEHSKKPRTISTSPTEDSNKNDTTTKQEYDSNGHQWGVDDEAKEAEPDEESDGDLSVLPAPAANLRGAQDQQEDSIPRLLGMTMMEDVRAILPTLPVLERIEDPITAERHVANRFVTAVTSCNAIIILCFLPKALTPAPPIDWPLRALETNRQAWQRFHANCNVTRVCALRNPADPTLPLTTGREGRLEEATWKCFIRFRRRKPSPQFCADWATQVGGFITSVTRLKCRYTTYWAYAGDVTPPEPQPLSYYITIPDVIQLLRKFNPNTTTQALLQRDDIHLYLDEESLVLAKEHHARHGNGTRASWYYNEPDDNFDQQAAALFDHA